MSSLLPNAATELHKCNSPTTNKSSVVIFVPRLPLSQTTFFKMNSQAAALNTILSAFTQLTEERRGVWKELIRARTHKLPEEEIEELNQLLTSMDADLARYDELISSLNRAVPSPAAEPKSHKPVPIGLPSFKHPMTIKTFLDKYEGILRTENFPDDRWVPVLERCFEGPDLHYIKEEVISVTNDWNKAKQLLNDCFGPRNPKINALRDLISFTQKPQETMVTCTNRFRELVAEADASENNILVAIFLQGINSWSRSKLEITPLFTEAEPDLPLLPKVLSKSLEVCDTKKPKQFTTNHHSYPVEPRKFTTNRQPLNRNNNSNPRINAVDVIPSASAKSINPDDQYSPPLEPSNSILIVKDNNNETSPFLAP